MGIHEAWLLVNALMVDPTSHLAAAVAGWKYPMSREALIAADQFDLTVAVNTDKKRRGKSKHYPRPFERNTTGRRSKAPEADQATIRAALAARGH